MRASSIILVALGLIFVACDEGPTGSDTPPEPGIVGLVLDVEGNPAVDAPLGLIFDVELFQEVWPPEEFGFEGERTDERAQMVLGFVLAESGTVTFIVQDFLRRPVSVLLDSELRDAGEYQLTWNRTNDDGDPVPNGLYGTLLEIEESGQVVENGGILINDLDLDYGVDVGEFTRTDAQGRFRIPFSELPLGETCYCPDYEDDSPDGLCTIPLNMWIQSAQGIGRVRQPVHPGGLTEDHEVTLRMDYLPD